MAERTIKGRMTSLTGEFMAAVLLLQPLLDVLSFFLRDTGAAAVTTYLRLGMLVIVSLYGFMISDRKQLYAAGYAVVAGFWLLHMLNCWRTGYLQPIGDTAEYLKLVQLPLWTLAFVTFFQKREGLDFQIIGILTLNFAIILLVAALSFVFGPRGYTYDFPERELQIGFVGWFAVPNAQSAILCLLAPAVLLWGLRTERMRIFCPCCAVCAGLLYLTGTRLTYYTAVLLAVAFIVLILLCGKPRMFCVPLLVVLILLVACKGVSPMERRQEVTSVSFSVYQEKIDEIMRGDKDFTHEPGEEIPPLVLEKIRAVYEHIYGRTGVYNEPLLSDLFNTFGIDAVMEEMDYTIDPAILNNSRSRKLTAMHMVWERQDFLTHLLGMEYADSRVGMNNYDPENDFHALLYKVGYLGVALYACFVLGILLYGAMAFVRRFPSLLTVEFAAAIIMFVLALGSAQFSGQVLRRPNVTVYASVAAALIYTQAKEAPPRARLRSGHKRNPAVYLKKIG